jgi:hypothetical protein
MTTTRTTNRTSPLDTFPGRLREGTDAAGRDELSDLPAASGRRSFR